MKKKQALAIFLACTILLSTSLLSGCGATDSTSTEETAVETEVASNGIQLSAMTFTGTVQSVIDDTVTLSVGSSSADMGGGEQAQMPTDMGQGGSGSAQGGEAQGETPPDLPEGEGDGQPSQETQGEPGSSEQAQMPTNGDGSGTQAMDSATLSGTVILTLGDASVLTNADGSSASLTDLEVGDPLTVTLDENGVITSVVIGAAGGMEMGTDMGMGDQMSAGVTSYNAAAELTEDTEVIDSSYNSTGTDENALHIFEGANVLLRSINVSRISSDSTGGDDASFYGVGAAVLVSDGSAVIEDSTITTDAAGGAGVFAYATGIAYVKDTTIRTTQNTSGGIHAAGGGTLYAWNLDVETNGESAAAIRSDRGGGTMVVDGGTYVSNGTGSPAVYCTADIAVNNATLISNASEGLCIEGKNSVHLFDCDLTSNLPDDSRNDCIWSLIVYQSMSGDAEEGCSTLQLVGGSVTTTDSGLIYTTNTASNILLSNVTIEMSGNCPFFLQCTGNANERGWGQTGSNGAQCVFTADQQVMTGDIIYDSISTLDCYLVNGSVFTGAVMDDESYAGGGGNGYCNLTLSEDSTWIVSWDSILNDLHSAGTIQDIDGQTVSIIGTDGTVYVQGNSSRTITVASFDTNADLSGAATVSSFSAYEVAYPEQ